VKEHHALTHVMSANAVVDQPPAGPAQASGLAPVYALPSWSAAAHLSPAAAFEPGRIELCTVYQLEIVDQATTPAAAHLAAARRHLAQAATVVGHSPEERNCVRDEANRVLNELNRFHHTRWS
jgi:hypothetical protein